ncbi:hypothetical protein B0H14DRAFT_3692239 [Mycena olivaceomarginata]|nr:hypothetical protein B0H14DRAFT_3692239 [Mycena olivaceomarginata]
MFMPLAQRRTLTKQLDSVYPHFGILRLSLILLIRHGLHHRLRRHLACSSLWHTMAGCTHKHEMETWAPFVWSGMRPRTGTVLRLSSCFFLSFSRSVSVLPPSPLSVSSTHLFHLPTLPLAKLIILLPQRTQTKLTSALGDPAQLTRLRLPPLTLTHFATRSLPRSAHASSASKRLRPSASREPAQGQKQACELEELRIREEHRAQLALCNFERSHTLTAQHAELQAHTQCALAPSFRVVRCPAHRSPYPEFHDSETLDLTPTFVGKHNHHHQAHGCGCERKAHKEETNSTAVTLEDIFSQLFGGGRIEANVEQLLQHVCGGNTAAQPKTESKPAKEAPAQQVESPITIEQLISHFLGAAGLEVEQSKGLSSNATASTPTSTQPSEKNKTAPVPATSQSAPKPVVAPAPIPATAQALQPVGCSAVQTSAPTQPQAGPSNSVHKTTLQEREERELTEAIRMSLAESQPQPSPITNENKGMAPAPAPVKDVASSTTEVQAINASFAALSSEFVFPTQLHFSTSRTASPTRNGTAEESVMANLSYSTQNQPLRFYHQALSGLLVRLDAVGEFW